MSPLAWYHVAAPVLRIVTDTDVTVCNSMNDGTDWDTNAAAYACCACAISLWKQQASANIVATSCRCGPARRYRGELTFTWPCLAESRSLLFRERIRRGFCDLGQRIAVGMMKGLALAADHQHRIFLLRPGSVRVGRDLDPPSVGL